MWNDCLTRDIYARSKGGGTLLLATPRDREESGLPIGLAGARAGPRAGKALLMTVFIDGVAVLIFVTSSVIAAVVYRRSCKPASPGGPAGQGDLMGAVGVWAAVVAALGLLLSFSPSTDRDLAPLPDPSAPSVSVSPSPANPLVDQGHHAASSLL